MAMTKQQEKNYEALQRDLMEIVEKHMGDPPDGDKLAMVVIGMLRCAQMIVEEVIAKEARQGRDNARQAVLYVLRDLARQVEEFVPEGLRLDPDEEEVTH